MLLTADGSKHRMGSYRVLFLKSTVENLRSGFTKDVFVFLVSAKPAQRCRYVGLGQVNS